MPQTFTITEMAEILAGAESSDDEKSLLHRQIRIFHKKGFLPAIRVKDARGTAEFDCSSLFRIRVMCALVAGGLDSDSGIFRAAVDAMNEHDHFSHSTSPNRNADQGAIIVGTQLHEAIEGVSVGKEWQLSFATRAPHIHGVRNYFALFHAKSDEIGRDLEGVAYKTIFSGELPLNELFADIVSLSHDA